MAAGARLALADARGRASGKRVRILEVDSARPGSETWDPATVEADAKRAADDPSAVAYVGELDPGASAVSVPVTDDKGLLQVSPGDGLTSLTRDEPGTQLASGPARYYPSGRRNFLRLVPDDYLQAGALVGWIRARGARRIAIVQDERLFGRELARLLAFAARNAGVTVADAVDVRDDPSGDPALAQRLAGDQPDAVVYTGLGDARAAGLLAAAHRVLPRVPLFAGSGMATVAPPPGLPQVAVLKPALPPAAYGRRGGRVLDRLDRRAGKPYPGEALYGYEAIRIVLDAVRTAGGGDRAAVVRAALAPRTRRSAIGRYRILPGGAVSTARFGAYRRDGGSLVYLGPRGPAPAP